MKTIIFILLSLSSCVYAQEIDSISYQLVRIKKEIKEKQDSLKIYETRFKELKLIQIQTRANNVNVISIGVILRNSSVRREPVYSASTIKKIKEGDTIYVVNYEKEYYLINKLNNISVSGYVAAAVVNDNPLLQQLRKNIFEIKEKESAEVRIQSEKKYKNSLINKYGHKNGIRIYNKQVWIGMTSELAIASWGTPIDINKTITADNVSEQWVYILGTYLYFNNGILTTIQQ